MKIDPRYVMGNCPQRWSMKVLFKERGLLLFSINTLPASVYNLNSSFPTRLPGYFQFLFSDHTAQSTLFYFYLFLYCAYFTLTIA
jgi:hypothetical protein